MTRRLSLPLLGVLLFGSVASHAGTLTSATWFQVVEARFGGLLPGIPMTRTSTELGATGSSLGNGSIAVSLSYPAFATTVAAPRTPSRPVDLAIQVTQGGPQAITATANGAAGAPGVPGTLRVVSAVHAAMGVDQSMFQVGVYTYVAAPLEHGAAGVFVNTFYFGGVTNQVTVDFFAWTPGTLTFTGLTSLGTPIPNVTVMGSFGLTPNGGGTVTLVAPTKVTIVSPYPQRTVGFATLKLSFVPEPGALLLLGAAAVAVARWTRRSR
jgi:hypothetical protein